jgi:hypothetical protein
MDFLKPTPVYRGVGFHLRLGKALYNL